MDIPSNSSSKDLWDKFKIIVESTIPVVALVWAILSWCLLRSYEQKASERQAQAAIAALESQRKISAAQVAGGLVSSLAKGTNMERVSALTILASVDPDLARRISTVLEQTAGTPTDREQGKKLARQIGELSARAKQTQDVLHRLENARVFQRFQLYAEADREYISAAGVVSSRSNVDQEKIKEAKSDYDDAKFEESARLFEQAFQEIPPP